MGHVTGNEKIKSGIAANAQAILDETTARTQADEELRELIADTDVGDLALRLYSAFLSLPLNTDGKIYGAKWTEYPGSTSYLGTRTQDAVGLTAEASTNLVAGTNDFDDIPIFSYRRVNGYALSSGEFVETAVEGDGKFATDGSNGDVYNRRQLAFFRYIVNGNEREIQVTDTPKPDGNGGWCPFGRFVRPDGTLKAYDYDAAYEAGYNERDTFLGSISGVAPAHGTYENRNSAEGSTASDIKFGFSNNLWLTEIRKKGTQYSGMTSREIMHLQTLFQIEFATRHSQSIMAGCTDFNYQVQISVASTSAECAIVSNADAEHFPVGCSVSIGTANSTSISRNEASMNSVVLFGQVTSKEAYDTDNTLIHIDNGGNTFTTTTAMYLSTMAWRTGMTDGVLGSSGSYIDNTSGVYPMMYRGSENLYGNLWTVVSDLIVSAYKPYICYDCKKYAANKTSDYEAVGYTVATTSNKYVRNMGYDANHPSVQMAVTVNGSDTTNYCDYHYTASGNNRVVLFGGGLYLASGAGLFFWHSNSAVSSRSWTIAGRVSVSGQSKAL